MSLGTHKDDEPTSTPLTWYIQSELPRNPLEYEIGGALLLLLLYRKYHLKSNFQFTSHWNVLVVVHKHTRARVKHEFRQATCSMGWLVSLLYYFTGLSSGLKRSLCLPNATNILEKQFAIFKEPVRNYLGQVFKSESRARWYARACPQNFRFVDQTTKCKVRASCRLIFIESTLLLHSSLYPGKRIYELWKVWES